jgi:hypothetical protein
MVASAQDEPAPEIRYVTMTRLDVPMGADRQSVLDMYERVIAPQNRMDPNVVSFSVATHNWGSNSNDIVIITEYADLRGDQRGVRGVQRLVRDQLPRG